MCRLDDYGNGGILNAAPAMASLSESSSIHSIQDEEKISFVGYINSALKVCYTVHKVS